MQITIIHGQQHKGSTYNVTKQILDNIKDEGCIVKEYFLPKDTPPYCVGCFQCIKTGEDMCPGHLKVQEIVRSMEDSNVVMIDSPNYCMEMTGQLKTLFDHLAYMWMSHRPREYMFDKVGVAISTTAGSGAKKVTKSIARQMFWIGTPLVYQCAVSANASSWEEVPLKIRESIAARTMKIAQKIKKRGGKAKPGWKQKVIFNIMRLMQKSNTWNLTDRGYWEKHGWLGKKRPWIK